jgi:TRAP-type C4-dicarboxylate transport system permease small subunit
MEVKAMAQLKYIKRLDAYIALITSMLMCILLFIQVVSRYLFKYAIPWAEELALISFVISTYAGISIAVTKHRHLKVDILTTFLPYRWKKALDIFGDLIFAAFCIYIIFPFMNIIEKVVRTNGSYVVTGIPKAAIYIMIPVFLIITAARLIGDIVELIKETEDKQKNRRKPILDLVAVEEEAKAKN